MKTIIGVDHANCFTCSKQVEEAPTDYWGLQELLLDKKDDDLAFDEILVVTESSVTSIIGTKELEPLSFVSMQDFPQATKQGWE